MDEDVADRLRIRELMERYADAVIRRSAPDWAATWADNDAEWRFAGASAQAPVLGKANIVRRWETRMAQVPNLYFHAQPAAITVAGDRASARSHTLEVFGLGTPAMRLVQGHYEDELVRQAGDWRFRVRTFRRQADSAEAVR